MKRYAFIILGFALPKAHAQDLLTTYAQALQRDPVIHQAESTRNAALESKPQSIAQLLPTISINGILRRSYLDSKTTFIPGQSGAFLNYWDNFVNLNLTQPLYHHELWVQLSQADNQVAQAEAQFEAADQNLILRTATAYFNILYAQDSLEFAKMELQSIERQLDQAKARFEVGLIAITDVDAAQAGFDQARASVIKTENDLENAKESMRVILGQFDGNISGLSKDIPLKPPEPTDMEVWNQRAQEDNLLIIAAKNQAEQAKKAIELQFAGHLPTLDLVGLAGFNDTNRQYGTRSEFETVGVTINVPIFQGGMVNSKVRQARELFSASQENLDAQRRNTINQVKTAYRGVITSISQVGALKSAVASAQSALDATEAGLDVGTRTMIDVLIQQRNLYQVKRDYAKTRYDYVTNSLSLKQAAGILMREDLEAVNHWLEKN